MKNATLSMYEQPCQAYKLAVGKYRRNFDLYHGGEFMEGENAKTYIKQRPMERDNKFARRIALASYRNFAAPTVDMFASSIFQTVERSGIEDIEDLKLLLENCNKIGDTPNKFFKDVATSAAAIGAHFVLVDSPAAPLASDGQPLQKMNIKEKRQGNFFPYFVSIRAEDLISWQIDPKDQAFDFVVFQSVSTEFESGPFSAEKPVKIITVWTRNSWQKYKSVDEGAFVPDGEGKHNLGQVPVVPFFYERHPLLCNVGISVFDDVASSIILLYNKDSERGEYCSDCALPVQILAGIKEDEAKNVYKASDALWCFNDKDVQFNIKEPSGASYNSLRQEAQDIQNSIREISLRQTKPLGAQVESAEAKRLDSVQLSSLISDFAQNMAASERRCWEMAGKIADVEAEQIAKIQIEYNEEFDPDALREQWISRAAEMRENGDISRETLWRKLGMNDEEIAEEKALLENEARTSGGASGSLGPTVAALLSRQGA